MNLDRFHAKCLRDRWTPDELPWDVPVAPLPVNEERALVQALTDLVAVEELAAVLFTEQARRASGKLRVILLGFVGEERRHAVVARRLAARFDTRRLEVYRPHPSLARFAAAAGGALPSLPTDVGNLAVTLGELVLDVALLRSLQDRTDDPVLREALRRIDRDESRHLAIDHHIVEVGLPEPSRTWRERAAAPLAWARLLTAMRPFVRDVLTKHDPVRLREAFRRFHQLGSRPAVRKRPFARLLLAARWIAEHPLLGGVLGRPVAGMLGTDVALLRGL